MASLPEFSIAQGPYEPVRVSVTPEAYVVMEVTMADGVMFVAFTPHDAALLVADLEAAIQAARRRIEAN